MKRIYFGFLFFCISILCFSQAKESAGVVIYSEGSEFSITRNNVFTAYDVYKTNTIGLQIKEGDMLTTEEGTFLEIQLLPSKNILKISENTSFLFKDIQNKGGGSFNLTYGRVRAKIDKVFNNEEFSIRGQSVVAGVRGTDFGYDVIADVKNPEKISDAQIYCFEGKVELTKVVEPPKVDTKIKPDTAVETAPAVAPVEEPVYITANQMAEIKTDKILTDPGFIETKEMDQEISQYWEKNDFKGEKVDPKSLGFTGGSKYESAGDAFTMSFVLATTGFALYFMGGDLTDENEDIGTALMMGGGYLGVFSLLEFLHVSFGK